MTLETIQAACDYDLYVHQLHDPEYPFEPTRAEMSVLQAMEFSGNIRYRATLVINGTGESHEVSSLDEGKKLGHKLHKRNIHGYIMAYTQVNRDYPVGWITRQAKVAWTF